MYFEADGWVREASVEWTIQQWKQSEPELLREAGGDGGGVPQGLDEGAASVAGSDGEEQGPDSHDR